MEEKRMEGVWEGVLGFHDLAGWAAFPASPRVHQPGSSGIFSVIHTAHPEYRVMMAIMTIR